MAIELEKLEKMPWFQKLLILGLVIAVLGVLFFYFLYTPVQKDLEAAQASLQANERRLAALERLRQERDQMTRELDVLTKRLEGYMTFIPSDERLTELLAAFSDFAVKSGVQISNIRPGTPRAQRNMYYELPIELQFTGPYWNVISFFYSLANPGFSRVVKFVNIDMSRTKGTVDERPHISVKCTAITYKMFGR